MAPKHEFIALHDCGLDIPWPERQAVPRPTLESEGEKKRGAAELPRPVELF
jgi:hypothetical protein